MPRLTRRQVASLGLLAPFFGKRVSVAASPQPKLPEGAALRRFAPSDAEAVAEMVAASYDNEPDRMSGLHSVVKDLHLSGKRIESGPRTIVAELAGDVVGVASTAPSSVGADARTHVIVVERHRRRGIGSGLYREIAAFAASRGKTPIASIGPGENVAYRFAQSCGMRALMRSRQLRVDLSSWALGVWAEAAAAQPSPYRFVANADVSPGVFLDAMAAAYTYMHRRWIQVNDVAATQLDKMWSPRVGPASGILALQGERPVGVANLFPYPAIDRGVAIFPAGVCVPLASTQQERALTTRLIANRLLAARAGGHRAAMLEFDDDDGRLLPVIASIPSRSTHEVFMLTSAPTGAWPVMSPEL